MRVAELTTITLENSLPLSETKYQDTPLCFETGAGGRETETPAKIRQMRRLARQGDGSLRQKAEIFYRQGKFMEDYEDDVSWEGEFRHYFPTYQDLSVRQLRGYFAWRTEIRQGNYRKISTSLAYIYLYELLNGIGAASVGESLRRMKEFEENYIDTGIGDQSMQPNLRRWMLEMAILNGVEPEIAREYADPEMLAKDKALAVLHNPEVYETQEVFKALDIFSGQKLSASVVSKKHESEGSALFAAVWRTAVTRCREQGRDLFKECFGRPRVYRWYPLANAVFFNNSSSDSAYYVLDECRKYRLQAGEWWEKAFHKLYFNKAKLDGLLREADRRLREYFNTGYFLKARSETAWATPYIDAVIAAEQKRKAEAARPKVSIRLADLDKIRQDARETMDSLLSEEEKQVLAEETAGQKTGQALEQEAAGFAEKPALKSEIAAGWENTNSGNAGSNHAAQADRLNLDETERQILSLLLADKPAKTLLAEKRILPEIIADRLNEAFFDEIGDTVIMCEADTIALVPEYWAEINRIIGGTKE